VIGDSTACTLLPGLEAVGPSFGLQFENGAVIACGIVSGQLPPVVIHNQEFYSNSFTKACQGQANRAEEVAINRYKPRIIVWASTEERDSIVVSGRTGSTTLESGTRRWRAVMLQRMELRVRQFTATGARVILLLEPPSIHGGNQSVPNASDRAFEQMNDLLREVAAQDPHRVAVVNLSERVCPSGPPCPYVVDGHGTISDPRAAIRPDNVHYLPAGSLWVATWLVPQLQDAARRLS